MYRVDQHSLDLLICEECDDFSLTSKIDDHNELIINYRCTNCGAEWVEYV